MATQDSLQTAADIGFRLLILGGGAIVSECHLPALRALGWLAHCEVIEPYERNVQILKAQFPELRVSQEPFSDMVADAKRLAQFDGVLIALPNTLHAQAAIACLRAGLPILCEKPLALTSGEYDAVEAAARKHGAIARVAMVRRFTPSLTALRTALEQNLIGDVLDVELQHGCDYGSWPSDTETVLRRDQGGCLVNMGIHFLDYLGWIFGELTPVNYRDDAAGGIEVNCELRLLSAQQVPITVRISWTHGLADGFRVHGSKGTLSMDFARLDAVNWQSHDGSMTALLQAPNAFVSGDWQATFESCFVEQLWRFAIAVKRTQPCEYQVDIATAARSHALIEWAYQNRGDLIVPARSDTTIAPPSLQNRPVLAPAAVVVTGGTGFVGSHLVERLAQLQMTSIVVAVRSFRSGSQIARFPATMKRTDLLSIDQCRATFRGAKHVFHLAYGTSGTDAAKITVEGTRNVLNAALAEGVESVVVFSTCTVWAGHLQGEIHEQSPSFPALADYGRAKLAMQNLCMAFARAHPEMRVSVIAPGAVYGPRGGLFCKTPYDLAKAGQFVWFDAGAGVCNYVYVNNLVDLALIAAQEPKAHGEVFIAIDGHTSWREFLRPFVEPLQANIETIAGTDIAARAKNAVHTSTVRDILKTLVNTPAIMATVSAHPLLGRLKTWGSNRFPHRHRQVQALRPQAELIRKNQPVPPTPALWLADFFGPSRVRFSAKKAQQMLGWQPLVDLPTGTQHCLAWLAQMDMDQALIDHRDVLNQKISLHED
jgi:predicted dehydrogenase/nucleoside-diphosphate-sugar epimerase